MDPIADMLTKIKNAQAVKKEMVVIPYSKIKMEISKVLQKTNYIKEISKRGKKNKKTIDLILGYDESGNGLISHVVRVSKPSRRVYLPYSKIKPVRQGHGMKIISTPKGLLTDKEVRKEKVGGEIICEIW